MRGIFSELSKGPSQGVERPRCERHSSRCGGAESFHLPGEYPRVTFRASNPERAIAWTHAGFEKGLDLRPDKGPANGRRDGAPAELSGEDCGALQSYGVDCPVCGFMRDIRAHTFKGHAEGRRTLFPDALGKKFPAQPNFTHFGLP